MLIDHLQAALQIRDDPVLQLCHPIQIATTTRRFQLLTRLFDFLLNLRRTLNLGFFRGPDFFEIGVLTLKPGDFLLKFLQTLDCGFVVFFFQGLGFDLELNQAPLKTVEHFRLGVDFHPNAAGRFVDQVDGLVRQLTISDIAMTQLGRRNDRAVSNSNLVVNLVALFQATQDRDGVFFAWLIHQHFLEAPFKGCVLLYILAVFVERGRADAVQLAASQRRLEHVACIHRAFAFTGADHGVQFIDEQDDLTFLLRQLVQQRFQPLFEFTTELGAGNQRAHVQRQHALAFKAIRHFTVDDPLGQALDNRGFTHARLTDQYRVVLGPALQYLNGSTNFVITTDHRVELAFFGALGEIDGVFIQRLTRLLDVGIIDRRTATQIGNGIFKGLFTNALAQQELAKLVVLVHCRQQHQLAGDELVALLLRQAISLIEQTRQILRHIHVAGRILDFRQLVELFAQRLTQAVDVKADLHQQRPDRTALLFKQRLHQVRRLDARMI